MTIEIKQRLLPDGQPNKPSCPMQPRYITIHNTDNTAPGATAESHARYILNGSGDREVSWHYTVDDKEIYQHLRDNEQGWHAGDKDGPGNTTSIGIEVCMYEGINEPQAWQRAAELVAVLLCRHGLAIGKVVPHKHWSGKRCPSRILPRWSEFIKLIEKELGKQAKPKSPAKATNILGKASATVEQAKAWARSHKAPAEFIKLADLYWELAPERGVDPAVAYVQFGHETGYLYRDCKSAAGIDASFCNPCGLKITAGGGDTQASAHKRFDDWRAGIKAHLDHLALYAGAAGYPRAGTPDPRHFAHLHGTAKTVEALGGKWAPSAEYGCRLADELAKLRSMQAPKQPDKPAMDYDGHWAEASIQRVMDAGIMGGRNAGFAPNEQITRAEMAVVVDRMLKQLGK
ncbi:N-acetylmuramoyl-L-alanine amidase [Paenibacillus popilliae]|uniref:N-acetylmuramoyl-L-alanine amidase n=1 Tax=Paenibacillus popilliae ATCC 14706 TaxID=1212764 RepID=M9LBS0_PAEPP|nr:N-acetylmuramoyl-L-alanine amidase [Paenibacillus popilliae]GAC43367.1 N-acetylmuramoyl-L-alanine amidase [Paenibacillus popilliae ATCC 14706]